MNRLTGLDSHLAAFRLHDQGTAQYDREFVKLRTWCENGVIEHETGFAVAAAALTAGLASATDPSTVTGAGAGLGLFAFGLATLVIPGRAATSAPEEPAQRSP